MFTGIIEETGTIRSLKTGSRSSAMTISAKKVLEDVRTGDSINVDGVCLTVVTFTLDSFTVDMMPETMSRSAFSDAKAGRPVNLERALRLSDRLGGHIVSGHIDDTGRITRIRNDENAVWFTVSVPAALLKYIVEKGSVAIDGISLTVASTTESSFEVSVIPHTQSVTTLLKKRTGDRVNIECDVIAKYLENLIPGGDPKKTLDMNFLAEQGFI
jgi:riboflavin synthase